MNNKARIASFLSQGMKPAQVATIVGVTPGYISQLIKEAKDDPEGKGAEFARLMAEYTQDEEKKFDEDKALTTKYLAMEHTILTAMESQMGFAELPALTRALEVVSQRQEKRAQRLAVPSGNGVTIQNVIQLTIPQHAIPEHVINSQKEVVAIGSQQLAPLSSDGVKGLFAQIQQQKVQEKVDKLLLPSTTPEDF